ncbi:MAG TPA: hypothetical protein VND64_35440 [Pirellulales bacterium]|nr:hypothetical protein [Pirellulales bacterium]
MDEIIAEIRRIREEHAKKFNYDMGAIFRDLRERHVRSGRKGVSLPPKRPAPVTPPLVPENAPTNQAAKS